MHLVVKTQAINAVKETSRKKGRGVKNIDSSFLPELNEEVMRIIEKALERASSNHRRTLMGKDI